MTFSIAIWLPFLVLVAGLGLHWWANGKNHPTVTQLAVWMILVGLWFSVGRSSSEVLHGRM